MVHISSSYALPSGAINLHTVPGKGPYHRSEARNILAGRMPAQFFREGHGFGVWVGAPGKLNHYDGTTLSGGTGPIAGSWPGFSSRPYKQIDQTKHERASTHNFAQRKQLHTTVKKFGNALAAESN